jgi:long-chain fatty acid transport protein
MSSQDSARLIIGAAAVMGAGLGFAPAAHAAGFYLQEQSVRGVGRAFSGEGADTGPDSLWWNPAAIAGAVDRTAYLGVAGILPYGTVSDRGSLIARPGQAAAGVGGVPSAHDPIGSGALPSGALAVPISSQFDFGLAISTPYEFMTNYDSTSWARYAALRTRLFTVDIQPSLAAAPTNWLRLGFGLNIEYSDATLTNALPNLQALIPDGTQSLKGDGWNVGWSVGAQVHNDVVTVGVSYKSSIRHTVGGQASIAGLQGPLAPLNGTVATHANFSTPWQVIVGTRIKASSRVTVNLQAVRLGWGKFDAITIAAPFNAALPENYRDTWSFAGGLDYILTPKWTLRAGVQYDQTPTRDGARDPRVPDADRVNVGLGASYQASQALAFDAGVSFIAFQDAPIDRPTAAYVGTPAQTPVLMSGELTHGHAFVLAFGGRYKF